MEYGLTGRSALDCLTLIQSGPFAISWLSAVQRTAPHVLGLAAVGFAICALLGTFYAVAFAVIGIWMRRDPESSLLAAGQSKETFDRSDPALDCPTFLVLIPAHNEGAGLIATIKSVLAQHYPQDRLHCIVVADNCIDATAAMAASAGAHVLIRTAPGRPGKGHALAWALARVEGLTWDAVCFIDADSTMEPQFLSVMAASLASGHQAIQGRYDFEPAVNDRNWAQQLSAVSKAAENSFVQRSRERLGLMLLLHGNGFCLRRSALRAVPWRAYSIVEDAEYSLALNRAGIAVRFQERARVWSRQPATAVDLQPQRIRWASGSWNLFRQAVPALLGAAWRRRSGRALEAVLMLLLTSRMLLIYALAFSFLLSLGAVGPLSHVAWRALSAAMALQLLYILLMFRFAAEKPVPLVSLLRLPLYLAVIASAQVLAVVGFNRRVWWRTAR